MSIIALDLFLDNPNTTTLQGIQNNPWMLGRAYHKNQEIANQCFTVSEWIKLYNNPVLCDLSEEDMKNIESKLELLQKSDT